MKTKLILLVLAFLCVASIAAAQTRPEPPMLGKPVAGHPMAGPNLTDEQKAKMDDLRVKHMKEVEPLKAELQKQHSALKLEITADKFNESKVKSIQAEIAKVRNDLAGKMVLHLRAVRDLLTPEQQKKFDARVLSGKGPGAGMQRGMGRGAGMGRGMGMGGGKGMEPGMGMHRGMKMDRCDCPCGGGDMDQPKPEPKK